MHDRGGAMHDRPDHGVTMESALLISLAFHGHRRTPVFAALRRASCSAALKSNAFKDSACCDNR